MPTFRFIGAMTSPVRHLTARLCAAVLAAMIAVPATGGRAADLDAVAATRETAWHALPTYRHGDDMSPLLTIQQDAIGGTATAASRDACAARLAGVLASQDATPDAKRWACTLLREIATPSEVSVLARVLSGSDAELAEAARQAIEAIPGDAAAAALRKSLSQATGRMAVGIIDALGRRSDVDAVPLLATRAASGDAVTADAAARALGRIGSPQAIVTLTKLAARHGVPTPPSLRESLLRAGEAAARRGERKEARAIYDLLVQQGQPAAVRQAALHALLSADVEKRSQRILEWLGSEDPDRRHIAGAAVGSLDNDSLVTALRALESHPVGVRKAVLIVASRRLPDVALPVVAAIASGPPSDLQQTAIECLGAIGTADCLPPLLAALTDVPPGDAAASAQAAARYALVSMPRDIVGPWLVELLTKSQPPRADIVTLVGDIREPAAWDALAAVARSHNPAPWRAAIESLGRIARPEGDDVSRLVAMYVAADDADRREAFARAIALLARQSANSGAIDAGLVALERPGLPASAVLPLAGRLGGARALAAIDVGLSSPDRETRAAAIEGLCNWPDAGVCDRLESLARSLRQEPESQITVQRVLKAYVRVVSLKSERPEAETLALLRAAMVAAADSSADDRGYILERTAAAVRSMDAVEWIAGHLDDPAVRQSACRAIVTLAHHRTLRQPNRQRFEELLGRVRELADDPAIAIRAERYTLGL
jgi:HEAT repeat protein